MKVLVTGNLGFVGHELSDFLVKEGHTVVGIDNRSTNTDDYYEYTMSKLSSLGVATYNVDLCDMESMESLDLSGIDIMYHLAAKARIQPSIGKETEYLTNNTVSTRNVISLAMKYGIPVIFSSSSSVVSDKELSPYSKSKLISENYISNFAKDHNYCIARLFNVYGENMPKSGINSTLVGRLMDCLDKGTCIQLYGDGHKLRDFTHIDDVVKVLYLLGVFMIRNKRSCNKLIEIGTGVPEYIISVISSSKVCIDYQKANNFESSMTRADYTTYSFLCSRLNQRILSFMREYSG